MSCPPQLWDGVVRRLAGELPPFTLDAWVRPLVAETTAAGLRLVCPSQFHRERVRDRLLHCITACVEAEAGGAIAIDFAVREPAGGAAGTIREISPAAKLAPPQPGQKPVAPVRIAGRQAPTRPARRASQWSFPCTFDSFVVGPCNALAREASFALASRSQWSLNLLYLKSDTGLGKTHLARAIAAESRKHTQRRTLYTSAESFTNEFMAAIRSKQMDRFKRRYREDCDLLIVEDMPFLESKAGTQLELFHTLTHLLDAGAAVVLTGNCLPRFIPDIDRRLVSQMTAGLVAELELPDARIRRQILRSKAASGGVGVPDDCLDLLVERVRGNVRDLEGVLIQLVSMASLLNRPIDLPLTESALHKVVDPRPELRRITPTNVIEVVATFFRKTPEALASRSRRRDVLVPRQLAMYLCRRFTDAPVGAIAASFGRSHSAVANAEKVIARAILERAPLRYQVEALTERLDQREREARGKRS